MDMADEVERVWHNQSMAQADVPTFVAVRVTVTVRLPVRLPDSEWMPYASQIHKEIRGALDAVLIDRIHRAPEMTDDVKHVADEVWEIQP